MVASQSNSAPSITVFGATGLQGGSVITHLLSSDKPYKIRAVTRDPSKPNAKALESKGIDVVKADLGNDADVQKVVSGQDYVFLVTNFWEAGEEAEIAQGNRVIDAAHQAGVKKIFFSSLENASKISDGKFTGVRHFVSKDEIIQRARAKGVPVVGVQAAMYDENFLGQLAPRKQDDGSFAYTLPIKGEAIFSMIHLGRDYGAFVRGAIENNVEAGTDIHACGDQLSVNDLVEIISKATGKTVKLNAIDPSSFQQMAGEDLTQMMQYIEEFGYYGGKDLGASRKILPDGYQPHTWEQFVKEADWSKILA